MKFRLSLCNSAGELDHEIVDGRSTTRNEHAVTPDAIPDRWILMDGDMIRVTAIEETS